jgi:hypothetical protein
MVVELRGLWSASTRFFLYALCMVPQTSEDEDSIRLDRILLLQVCPNG